MGWLNYHHLLYFWTVVREGSVSAASRKLRLAQPTISEQIKALEETLEVQLFQRQRGRLVLTEAGAHAYRYADEIFTLGRELQESLAGHSPTRAPKLVVGIADVVPKLIAQRLLEPALRLPEPVRLVCYEDRQERLLAELAAHTLDLVLTDAPVGTGSPVRAFSHLLGECGVTLFAPPTLAERLRRHFPKSLEGEPFLMPTDNTSLARALTRWLEEEGVRPRIRGEFQDSALLKAFGQTGLGVFPASSAIEEEVKTQYHVEVVGRLESVRERYYAITVERRVKNPAVLAISQAARNELFAAS
jgi:LysR family transcriptional activator of nhaA